MRVNRIAPALAGIFAGLLCSVCVIVSCDSANSGNNTTTQPPATNNCTISGTLPPEVLCLESGMQIELVTNALTRPVKMVFAPDGRLFVNELNVNKPTGGHEGRIRIIDNTGALLPTPFAAVDTISPPQFETGLFGIALSPNFTTDNFVYVMAAVPGAPNRQQVLRFTASGNVAAGPPTVIVDNLPVNSTHNGGDLKFLPDGTLLVSVGDAGNSARSQTDGDLAGRILRYNANGTIPTDNPIPGDPEYVRGLRNSFDIALHPTTNGVFASENGPNVNDELNFIQVGKNFEWENPPPGLPGSQVGLRVALWPSVIAPTGLTWHDGTMFGTDYANSLFVCSYGDSRVIRLQMSGFGFTDVDAEVDFIQFVVSGIANKPLDILQAPDGSLYVSTESAIWRVYK